MPLVKSAPAPEQLKYLKADANYTWHHYRNAPPSLSSLSLKVALVRLGRADLLRIHRSTAVNPAYVVGLVANKPSGGYVVLSTGEELPVARGRFAAVKAALSTTVKLPLN